MVGHAVARVDRGQPARKIALAGHGQRRAPDPRDQSEQGAQARDRRSDVDERNGPVRADRTDRALERRHARRELVRAEHEQHRRGDDRVHGDGDAERQRDRARDRPPRVANLFAERRDPRVAGEREEEEARRLEHAVEAVGKLPRQVARPASPLPRITPTTIASATSETATRIRVRPAVRVMPRRLTPVSVTTATAATRRSSQRGPGTA